MVSIMFFMVFIVAIIAGIIATSCGIRVSRCSRSGTSCWTSSVRTSMPSRVSKIDRSEWQTGMS